MLDLIHYYFETDSIFISEEHMMSQSKSRESIYGSLYDREYKYKYVEKSNGRTYIEPALNDLEEEDDALPKPFDPLAGPAKPYIPPTQFDPDSTAPFGSVLDAPLG